MNLIRNRWVVVLLVLGGCAAPMRYSFKEGGPPEGANSIGILTFANEAGNGPPTLSQQFSEDLREFYQNQTRLEILPYGGDLELTGAITGYRVVPVAPTSTGQVESSGLSRLQITVTATYTNYLDETGEDGFVSKPFTYFADFQSEQSLASVEAGLIDQIFEQLVLDIYQASFANW